MKYLTAAFKAAVAAGIIVGLGWGLYETYKQATDNTLKGRPAITPAVEGMDTWDLLNK